MSKKKKKVYFIFSYLNGEVSINVMFSLSKPQNLRSRFWVAIGNFFVVHIIKGSLFVFYIAFWTLDKKILFQLPQVCFSFWKKHQSYKESSRSLWRNVFLSLFY